PQAPLPRPQPRSRDSSLPPRPGPPPPGPQPAPPAREANWGTPHSPARPAHPPSVGSSAKPLPGLAPHYDPGQRPAARRPPLGNRPAEPLDTKRRSDCRIGAGAAVVAVASGGSDGLSLEPPAGWVQLGLLTTCQLIGPLAVVWFKRGANADQALE